MAGKEADRELCILNGGGSSRTEKGGRCWESLYGSTCAPPLLAEAKHFRGNSLRIPHVSTLLCDHHNALF